MKKYFIPLIITYLILCLSTNSNGQTQSPTPEKRYPIYLTLNQIQVLVTAVRSPDDVSANAKKNVLQDIINQANAALEPTKKDSTQKQIQKK